MTQAKLIAGGIVALILVGLIAVVFWYRGNVIAAEGERDQWKSAAEQFRQANETNVATIGRYKEARQANDKIASDLAAEVAALKARGVQTRVEIREVYVNDPAARSWSDTPVPDSLRDAANRR